MVAVDAAGSVYVTEGRNNRVVKLSAGSSGQTVVPFSGISDAEGVAVDPAGGVLVVDRDNAQVVKLPANP
jgi:DNA-binding beta-propeller fold protein YncE